MTSPNLPLRDRFLLKVEITPGCWLWKGAVRQHTGYGTLRLDPTHMVLAHRLSYELFVGDIPDGLHVCHHCDVRHCVNPAHLFTGTRSDNMKDAYDKGRLPHMQRLHTFRRQAG